MKAIQAKKFLGVAVVAFSFLYCHGSQAENNSSDIEKIAGGKRALVVLGCYGRYFKLDQSSGRKLANGIYGDFGERKFRLDGCLISNVHLVPDDALYAVLLKDLNGDENGEQRSRVAALDTRTLKMLRSYDLPKPIAGIPTLIFDPSRDDFILSYDDVVQRLEILSGFLTPSAVVKTHQTLTPVFTEHSYVDEHGDIVDGLRTLNPSGEKIGDVQLDSILVDSKLRQKYESLRNI